MCCHCLCLVLKSCPHAPLTQGCFYLQEGEAQFVRTRKYALYTNKDVPSRALADADSKFLSCCGLDVHYKEAFPEARAACWMPDDWAKALAVLAR